MACCTNCGKEYTEGTIYCARCGEQIKKERSNKVFIAIPVIVVLSVVIGLISYYTNNDRDNMEYAGNSGVEDDYNQNDYEYIGNNDTNNDIHDALFLSDNDVKSEEDEYENVLFGESNETSSREDIAQAFIDAINSGIVVIDDLDSQTVQYEIDDMDGDGRIDLLIGCYYIGYDSELDYCTYYTEYRIYSYEYGQIKQICDFKSSTDDGSGYSYSKKTKLFYEDIGNCGLVAIYEFENGELVKTDYEPGAKMYYSSDYESSALMKYCTKEELIRLLEGYL